MTVAKTDAPEPDAVTGPDYTDAFLRGAEPPDDPPAANVYTALAAVQAELPRIARDAEAKKEGISKSGREFSYSYKYADLASVSAAVLPLLGRNGLAWVTRPTAAERGLVLRYELVHGASDTKIEGVLPIRGEDPQVIGGQITYMRRYALSAVVGLAAEEDDDAQHASERLRDERSVAAANFDSLPKDRPGQERPAEAAAPPASQGRTDKGAGERVATNRQVDALAANIATKETKHLINVWSTVVEANARGRKPTAERLDMLVAPWADRSEEEREGLPDATSDLTHIMAWRLANDAEAATTLDELENVATVARAIYKTLGNPRLVPADPGSTVTLGDYLIARKEELTDKPLPDTDNARTLAQEAAGTWAEPEGADEPAREDPPWRTDEPQQ